MTRRLTAQHLADARAAFEAVHDEAPDDEWLGHWLGRDDHHLVVAYEDDRPVGLAYGYELIRAKRRGTALLLYEIDVVPDRRRRGHGRAMIEHFLALCADRGIPDLWLVTEDVNEAAVALYRSTGGRPDAEAARVFSWRVPAR